MRAGRRVAVLATWAAVVAVVLPACGGDDSAELATQLRREKAGAKLKVEGPKDGKAAGNVVGLKFSGAGVKIVEPKGDTSGKTGHYVVFLDAEPVDFDERIPEDNDIVHTFKSAVTLTGLTAGHHEVVAVLADGAGRRIGTKEASTEFTVTAPTLKASALEKSPAKEPVLVNVSVEQVTVVPPDGSTAPGTGHFAVFIDRDPTAMGKPVPSERGILLTANQPILVPDLGNGEHDLWIVLVRGDATPYDPLVADRVSVEVG